MSASQNVYAKLKKVGDGGIADASDIDETSDAKIMTGLERTRIGEHQTRLAGVDAAFVGVNEEFGVADTRLGTLEQGLHVPSQLIAMPIGQAEAISYVTKATGSSRALFGITKSRMFIAGPNGTATFTQMVGDRLGKPAVGMSVFRNDVVCEVEYLGDRTEGGNRVISRLRTVRGAEYRITSGGLTQVAGPAPQIDYIMSSDGTYSAPADDAQICYLISIQGQSNGLGQSFVDGNHPTDPAYSCTDSNDPMLDTGAVYPNEAFMLRADAPQMFGGARSNQLYPLKEKRQNDGSGDAAAYSLGYLSSSPLSGLTNHFIALHEAKLGYRPTCIAFGSCRGSTAYSGLRPGTDPWYWNEQAIRDAGRFARSQGKRPVLYGVVWAGSESDITQDHSDSPTHMTTANEAKQIMQFQRHATASARALLDPYHQEVLVFMSPPALVGEFDPFDQPLLQAYEHLRNHPYIRIVGGGYESVANTFDHVHRTSVWQNRTGQKIAWAMSRELFGLGCTDVYPVEHWWIDSTHYAIRYNVPISGDTIVLDTSGNDITLAGIPGYYGNVFDDGSGSPPTITGHSINIDVVTFTLSAASTGKRPRHSYATTYQTLDHTGSVDGPRGCLRASSSYQSLYDGHLIYNWATAHTRNLY